MGRAPCCAKEGLRKGPWSTNEDLLLTNYINKHGEGQWRSLPKNAGNCRFFSYLVSYVFGVDFFFVTRVL